MTTHYHIITCDDVNKLQSFVRDGMAGVRPVITKKLSLTVRMNWDILADIARVKKGDYIFLHAQGIIIGAFEVIDDPLIKPENTRLFNSPKINTQNWKDNWSEIQEIIRQRKPIWWIPIKPLVEKYFKKMDMNIIFEYIAREKITSLPQRLRYEDKNKTVKGITKRDFTQIINLFYNYSSANTIIQISQQMSCMVPIDFDYLTSDRYEKNLEAIIVHRIRSGNMEIVELSQKFDHSNILNTVPLGYLKMADLLTWNEVNNEIINPWIWELKPNSFNKFENLQEEIRKLSIRASHIKNLWKDGYKVTGIVLAAGFPPNVKKDLQRIILPIGSLEEIILVSYKGEGANVTFKVELRKG